MIQPGCVDGLGGKPADAVFTEPAYGKDLQRYQAAQGSVVSSVDLFHAAGANERLEVIAIDQIAVFGESWQVAGTRTGSSTTPFWKATTPTACWLATRA